MLTISSIQHKPVKQQVTAGCFNAAFTWTLSFFFLTHYTVSCNPLLMNNFFYGN